MHLLTECEESGRPIGISAITLWEMAMLAARGRIVVSRPLELWLSEVENDPLIEVFPLTSRIAVESAQLGDGVQIDPADRIIIATACCHGLPLMTADDRIHHWGKVQLI